MNSQTLVALMKLANVDSFLLTRHGAWNAILEVSKETDDATIQNIQEAIDHILPSAYSIAVHRFKS